MDYSKETASTIYPREELDAKGFTIINEVFCNEHICVIESAIAASDQCRLNFRKHGELFAIRQFLKEVPQVAALIFTTRLKEIIREVAGGLKYFVVKSIYFDKPGSSNWFVAYHQDLTISVKEKHTVEGFGPWSQKQGQFAVQPPISILQSGFTIRIHLDDTDENNGTLRVIPFSHRKDVYRPETIDWSLEKEETCCVKRGGIMVMKPLLLHASSRTVNARQRRVIHIEFNHQSLPAPLEWSERLVIPQ